MGLYDRYELYLKLGYKYNLEVNFVQHMDTKLLPVLPVVLYQNCFLLLHSMVDKQ